MSVSCRQPRTEPPLEAPWAGPPPGAPPPPEPGGPPFAALLATPPTARTAAAEGETESPEPTGPESGAGSPASPASPASIATPASVETFAIDSAAPAAGPTSAESLPSPPSTASGDPANRIKFPVQEPGNLMQFALAAGVETEAAPSAAAEGPAGAGAPTPGVADPSGEPTLHSTFGRTGEAPPTSGSSGEETLRTPQAGQAATAPEPAEPSTLPQARAGQAAPSAARASAESAPTDPSPPGGASAPPAPTPASPASSASPAPPAAPAAVAPTSAATSGPSTGSPAPGPGAAPSPATAVEATIRLAATQGFSRARLTLKPAELGHVEVVLRSAAGGVTASLLADTPEAARLLEAAAPDLRRRLESQGLELLGLAVTVTDEGTAGTGREGAPGRGAERPGAGSAAAPLDEPPTPTRTIELGDGVLIDVLA